VERGHHVDDLAILGVADVGVALDDDRRSRAAGGPRSGAAGRHRRNPAVLDHIRRGVRYRQSVGGRRAGTFGRRDVATEGPLPVIVAHGVQKAGHHVDVAARLPVAIDGIRVTLHDDRRSTAAGFRSGNSRCRRGDPAAFDHIRRRVCRRRTLGGRGVAPFGEVRQSRRRPRLGGELLFVDLRSRVQ
jgi:hypothetical protein